MPTTEVFDGSTELTPHSDWRDLAVCTGKTVLFFARNAERPEARGRRETKARRLCDVCPVQSACREYARQNHLYGFWGGESEGERHRAGYSLTAAIGIRRGQDDLEESAARQAMTRRRVAR